jgi:hypothetical protein
MNNSIYAAAVFVQMECSFKEASSGPNLITGLDGKYPLNHPERPIV